MNKHNKKIESMHMFLSEFDHLQNDLNPRCMKSMLEYQQLKRKILDEHSDEDKELLEKTIQTLKEYLKDKEDL